MERAGSLHYIHIETCSRTVPLDVITHGIFPADLLKDSSRLLYTDNFREVKLEGIVITIN